MNIVFATLHVRPSLQAIPLAAGCLAAALPDDLRRGTRLIDGFVEEDEEILLARVRASGPDLLAFPLYVWNRERVLALVRRLRDAGEPPFLVAGGPEASTGVDELFAAGFDALVCGEGEKAFVELAIALSEGGEPEAIAGVLRPGRTAQKALAPPPEEWPSPWLSGVLRPEEGGGVLWELSRGCPFACDFCFDGRGSSGVRQIVPERMEAELDHFIAAGVSHVWVLDSTFNYPPERGKALLRLIEERKPPIHFHFEAKADFIDRETARLLARIPCSVQVGLQSVHPEVLANIRRPFDAVRFAEKMHLLAAEDVTFGCDLIYGLPGDDHEGFCRSLDTALEFAPNHLDIFPLSVLPGTPLHRRVEEFGIRAESKAPYHLIESASCTAADLERSRRLAAATDLFYNIGRAVGFFPALTMAARRAPSAFLEGFARWALECRGIGEEEFLDAERWEAADALKLQEGYLRYLLEGEGRPEMLPAVLDLVRYHYHHAEALLGAELLVPPRTAWEGSDLLGGRWRRAPQLRLVTFSYEVLDLEALGEVDLEQFIELFRPVGSLAIFFRREGEVFCESLEEDFARLLRGCDGHRSAAEVFGGAVNPRVGEEIVEFAVAEGFLVPAED